MKKLWIRCEFDRSNLKWNNETILIQRWMTFLSPLPFQPLSFSLSVIGARALIFKLIWILMQSVFRLARVYLAYAQCESEQKREKEKNSMKHLIQRKNGFIECTYQFCICHVAIVELVGAIPRHSSLLCSNRYWGCEWMNSVYFFLSFIFHRCIRHRCCLCHEYTWHSVLSQPVYLLW